MYLFITFLMLDTQQYVGENIETAPNRVKVDHGTTLVQYIFTISRVTVICSPFKMGSYGRLRKLTEADLLYHIQFF